MFFIIYYFSFIKMIIRNLGLLMLWKYACEWSNVKIVQTLRNSFTISRDTLYISVTNLQGFTHPPHVPPSATTTPWIWPKVCYKPIFSKYKICLLTKVSIDPISIDPNIHVWCYWLLFSTKITHNKRLLLIAVHPINNYTHIT